jgi:hypothetical protein
VSKNEGVTSTPDLPPLPDPTPQAGGEPPPAPWVPAPSDGPAAVESPAAPAAAPDPTPPVAPVEPPHPTAVSSSAGGQFPAEQLTAGTPGPQTDGKAVAALVCAILSWFVGPIVLAIVALFLARSAEKAIAAAPSELTGQGLVSGARWVAWIHLVLVAMVIAFLAAFTIALSIGR